MTFASLTPLDTAVCIAGLLAGLYLWLHSIARSKREQQEARAARLADRAFTLKELERIEFERDCRAGLDDLPVAPGFPERGAWS